MNKRVLSVLVLSLAIFHCSSKTGKDSTTSTTAAPIADVKNPSEIMAQVGDQKLTAAELTELTRPRMAKIDSQIYQIQKDEATEWVNATLLEAEAKKRGISVEKLLNETTAGITVSESDIKEFYEKNKARIGQEFDAAKGQITGRLQGMKRQEAVQKLLASLQKNTEVKVNLQQPRANIVAGDHPSKGKKDAPITLIEFSDFQCPFCHRARETVNQILSAYGNKVHYVFRDFPLSFHKDAMLAHASTHCAGEQDKYWEYSNVLWENQQNLKRDNLVTLAKNLKLNEDKFTKCIDSGKYVDQINKSIKEGSAVGVTGTPAYFINGRFISGAQPFENFKEVIDEELELAKKK